MFWAVLGYYLTSQLFDFFIYVFPNETKYLSRSRVEVCNYEAQSSGKIAKKTV